MKFKIIGEENLNLLGKQIFRRLSNKKRYLSGQNTGVSNGIF
jgi:hypothetical protein